MRLTSWTCLALAGCTNVEDPAFASGSRGAAFAGSAVEVGEGEIPAVLRVSFQTDEPAYGSVAFGQEQLDHEIAATASEDGLSHSVDIVGLPAGSTWTVRPQAEVLSGETWFGDAVETTLPDAPDPLTYVSVEVEADSPRWVLGASPVGDPSGIFVVNEKGETVWWWEAEEPLMDAQLLADGSGIVSVTASPYSLFRIHDLDGGLRVEVQISGAHHGAVELPDGHFALIVGEVREVDGIDVEGDTLVDVSPDGEVTGTIWTAWDSFTPDVDTLTDITTTGALDWTHMNSVIYDEATDTLWAGLRGWESVIEIDHATGGTNWVLGGVDNDFDLGDAEPFLMLHWPRRVDGGILLFDNGDPTDRPWSRAVEFALDTEAKTATEVWSREVDEERFSGINGSVERLASGNTQISWGEEGIFEEVDPDGEVAWQLLAEAGHTLGFAHSLTAFGDL